MAIDNVNNLITDMGIGWNLGNTFDCYVSNPNRTDLNVLAHSTPTSWGTIGTQKCYFDALKHLGFKTIRFPITWANHVDPATNKVDIEYLDYINTFVDYIVNVLGMYCIINSHYDDKLWYNTNTIISDPSAMTKYLSVWTDIANYFKGYSKNLIFAAYNEVLDSQSRWDNTDSVSLANLNVLVKNFVTTVRKVSGNESRFLCIPAYAAKAYALKSLVLPDDKCFSDIHIYTTSVSEIKSKIDLACDSKIPFIIGEFGLGASGYDSISSVSSQNFLITYARTNGISCCLWDDYGGMQFLKRNLVTPDNYKDYSNFNGYLIDAPKSLIDSSVIKNVSLYSSSRKYYINVGDKITLYPLTALNRIVYNYNSNPSVASFSDMSNNVLTAVSIGTSNVTAISTYGYVANQVITVGKNTSVKDNYSISLQNIDNWDIQLSRTIDVLSSNLYIIKCPVGYQYILEEMDINNNIISRATINSNYELYTTILTVKLKITIISTSKVDYYTLMQAMSSNLVDLTILYSKYRDEIVTDYNESGIFAPSFSLDNSRIIVETKSDGNLNIEFTPNNNIVQCESLVLNQNIYKLLSSDATIDLSKGLTLSPVNTTQVVKFNAVDPSIVNVSLKGFVIPLKEGTTDILITCGEKSLNCSVIVDFSVATAKEKLSDVIKEELYVQSLMVSQGINNADKLALDALIIDSNVIYNSATVTSSDIYSRIDIANSKLLTYRINNNLYYKYISALVANSALFKTNALFGQSKKIEVVFRETPNLSVTNFITTELGSFTIRFESSLLRIYYGSNNQLSGSVISVGSMNKLEISKNSVGNFVVLNGSTVFSSTNGSLSTDSLLKVMLPNTAIQLFSIKVYNYSDNVLLYNLMPVVINGNVCLQDFVNNVTIPFTSGQYVLGSLAK